MRKCPVVLGMCASPVHQHAQFVKVFKSQREISSAGVGSSSRNMWMYAWIPNQEVKIFWEKAFVDVNHVCMDSQSRGENLLGKSLC